MTIDDLMCKAFAYAWAYSSEHSWRDEEDGLRAALQAAIDEAVAAEREACAKACDALTVALDNAGNEYRREAPASYCAKSIRARR